jgi:hypothetical protein
VNPFLCFLAHNKFKFSQELTTYVEEDTFDEGFLSPNFPPESLTAPQFNRKIDHACFLLEEHYLNKHGRPFDDFFREYAHKFMTYEFTVYPEGLNMYIDGIRTLNDTMPDKEIKHSKTRRDRKQKGNK